MDDFTRPTRRLADVPVLSDLDPVPLRRRRQRQADDGGFGVFTEAEVVEFADQLSDDLIEWQQVVGLRRRASEAITDESDAEARRSGRPLTKEDRILLGRAVIRRVVGDHVRALHREGADLWSTERELAYVQAVENAVFGYGRLQPLLDLPDVENIEIHGWSSVVVQYGDGRREKMPPIADSDDELVEAIRFLGQNNTPSRPFDDTHPTMTLALGERFRLHAIGFDSPTAPAWSSVSTSSPTSPSPTSPPVV